MNSRTEGEPQLSILQSHVSKRAFIKGLVTGALTAAFLNNEACQTLTPEDIVRQEAQRRKIDYSTKEQALWQQYRIERPQRPIPLTKETAESAGNLLIKGLHFMQVSENPLYSTVGKELEILIDQQDIQLLLAARTPENAFVFQNTRLDGEQLKIGLGVNAIKLLNDADMFRIAQTLVREYEHAQHAFNSFTNRGDKTPQQWLDEYTKEPRTQKRIYYKRSTRARKRK